MVASQEPKLKPRTAAPGDVEVMALVQLSAVPVLVSLQDGNTVEVMADSWTSVSDIEKQASWAAFFCNCMIVFPRFWAARSCACIHTAQRLQMVVGVRWIGEGEPGRSLRISDKRSAREVFRIRFYISCRAWDVCAQPTEE